MAKIGTLAVGAALGIGLITVVFGGEAAISRTEFCISCHSEIYPYEELKSLRIGVRLVWILVVRIAMFHKDYPTSTKLFIRTW